MTEKDEYILKITKEERTLLISAMGTVADMYLSIANDKLYKENRKKWLELHSKIVSAEKTKGE